jgi:hypothetical protein
MSLDEALKKLRYVKRWPEPESEIRHEDLNMKVDALKAIRDVLKSKVGEDPLVDELDKIIRLIPYVKAGDVVEPEHHNLVVDALYTVRDILDKMESEYIKMMELLKAWTWALGIGLEYAVSPTIKLFYKAGTINYMDCNLYNQSPYSEMVLEKFTSS